MSDPHYDINEPECHDGECTANTKLGMCIYCGATMFEEQGEWYHHSQEDIPLKYRNPQFVKPNDHE